MEDKFTLTTAKSEYFNPSNRPSFAQFPLSASQSAKVTLAKKDRRDTVQSTVIKTTDNGFEDLEKSSTIFRETSDNDKRRMNCVLLSVIFILVGFIAVVYFII